MNTTIADIPAITSAPAALSENLVRIPLESSLLDSRQVNVINFFDPRFHCLVQGFPMRDHPVANYILYQIGGANPVFTGISIPDEIRINIRVSART